MPPVKKIKIQEMSVELYSALPPALQTRYKELRSYLKERAESRDKAMEKCEISRKAIEARPDYPCFDLFVSFAEQRQEIYERQQAMKNADADYNACRVRNGVEATLFHDAACQFARFKSSAAFLFEIPHLEIED
jgi:hypothetical protein